MMAFRMQKVMRGGGIGVRSLACSYRDLMTRGAIATDASRMYGATR